MICLIHIDREGKVHIHDVVFTWVAIEIERGMTGNDLIDASITRNSTRDANQVDKH